MKLTPRIFILIIFVETIFTATLAQKSIELQPIVTYGGKYMYDRENADGRTLQVPLLSLGNPEVNRHYNNYKTFRRLSILSIVPIAVYFVGYLFTSANFNQTDNTTVQILTGVMVVGGITFNSLSNSQLRKAVDIYNKEISPRGSIGIQVETLPGAQKMISAGYRFRF